MAVYRVEGGPLVEHCVARDHLGLLQQLGISPSVEIESV